MHEARTQRAELLGSEATLRSQLLKTDCSARTVGALWKADKRLEASFPKMTLPVFIIHGPEDTATAPAGSEFFHKTASSKDKTLKIYNGHFHDLLADSGKEGVMADIQTWIDQHMPK